MRLLRLLSIIVAIMATSANANGQLYTKGSFCFKPYSGNYNFLAGATSIYAVSSGNVSLYNNEYVLPSYAPLDQIEFCGEASGNGYISLYRNGNYIGDLIIRYDDEAPSTPELNIVTVGTNDFTIDAISSDLYLSNYIFTIKGGGLNESGSSTTGSLTKIGLKEGTTYTVTAKAVDLAGNESEESTITVTTKRTLQKPSNCKATASYETVKLSWNSVYGATQYKIYKGNSLIATVSGTSYTVQGLDVNTTYKFKICATNGASTSDFSDFPNCTTKNFAISGPNPLCSIASYTISGVDGVNYSVSNVKCNTSTVKIRNGSTNSFELQKIKDGESYIEITVKSKSTNKQYTRRYNFVAGIVISDINFPTTPIYSGQTNKMSMKKTYPGNTYTWNIDMSRITSGQGTGTIYFIVDATVPTRSAINDGNTNKYRSTLKRKPSPTTNPTPVYNIRGSVTTKNSCYTSGITSSFTIPYTTLRQAAPDSLDIVALSEDIPLAIESELVPQDNSFVVYPNPASSVINIRQPYDKECINTVDIFDATGRKCISEVFNNNDSFATIDIATLPNGTYILVVNKNGDAQTCTFIKK